MTSPQPQPGDRNRQIEKAHATARRTIQTLALANGTQPAHRPASAGSEATIRDAEPLAAMRAARDLELATRNAARNYIQAAREAGHSWHDIGTALELFPDVAAQHKGENIAEAAFTYAAGDPDSEHARRYGRTFAWTCGTCDNLIIDHGPAGHPADDEHGHEPACERLIKTIEEWDAEWEAIEADFEAGQ